MDDPLAAFITGILGLTKLPLHLPTLVLSFLGFLFVHQVLAPWGSNYWFPEAYRGKSARARNSWYACRSDLVPKSISNSNMASGLDVQVHPCCIANPYGDRRAALVTGHLLRVAGAGRGGQGIRMERGKGFCARYCLWVLLVGCL